MTFWQRYEDLCLERGFKPSSETAIQLTGVSSAAITSWKKGAIPKIEIMTKIADYFGVDIRYLIGITDKKHNEDIIERITDSLIECGVEIDTFDDNNGAGLEYVLTYNGKSFNYPEHDYLALCNKVLTLINDNELNTVDRFCRTTFGNEPVCNKEEEDQLIDNYRKLSLEGRIMVQSRIISELRRQE